MVTGSFEGERLLAKPDELIVVGVTRRFRWSAETATP